MNRDVVREKDGRGKRMVRRGRNRVEEMQNIWEKREREENDMSVKEAQDKGQGTERPQKNEPGR